MSTPQSFVLAWITYRWHQLSDNRPFWPTESKHSLVWSQNNCFISRSLGCAVRGHKLCKCTNRCLDDADPQRYPPFLLALTLYSICFYHHAVTFRNHTFCPHSVFTFFCTDLRTNSDLFPLQHWLTDLCNRDGECLLRGTDWVFTIHIIVSLRGLIGSILYDSLNWPTFDKDEVRSILSTNSRRAMTVTASCRPLTVQVHVQS